MVYLQDLDRSSIKDLGLSRRTFNVLRRSGVYTVGELKELFQNSKLEMMYFIGQKSIDEVSNALAKFYGETLNPLPVSPSVQVIATNDVNFAPIETLNLPPSIRGTLIKHGIKTVGDLRQMTDEMLLNINRIGPKVLIEIQQTLKSLVSESDKYALKNNIEDKLTTIQNNIPITTWAELVQSYFESEKDNYTYILLSRFSFRTKKLEEIALELNITRERVRQIQGMVIGRFLKYVRLAGSTRLLYRIDKILSDYGNDLSLEKFRQKLEKENLLGDFVPTFMSERISKIDPFETLICWLNLLSDSRHSQPPVSFSIDIRSLINSVSISIKDTEKIRTITPKLRRKIKRKVNFTGGISLKEASKILSEDEHITELVLRELNLKKNEDAWFTLKKYDAASNKSRIPLQIAGLKMLAVKSDIQLDVFYDGLRKYINRFYPTLAPMNVVVYALELLGFEINNQQIVSSKINGKNILSQSEKTLVSAITKYNGIASFLEIAEEFFLQNLSLPAVSVTLKRSPIAEKVDEGFYKLRGTETSWQQIENAKKRQKRFSQDEEVTHGLDGIVRARLTVNNYAYLTGVIGSYSIKGLAGSWSVIYNNESFGDAKMDEVYLWGLPKIFKKLDVQIGDRIELAFNTWHRTLSVEKVNDGNTR